jgi:hypothetical protein
MAHSYEYLNNEALYEASYTPEIIVSVDGTKTAPSSATLTLYDPAGTVKVAARTCAINNTTKKITATFTGIVSTGEISELSEDWRLLLSYVIGGVTYQVALLFDVCRFILVNPVSDADLLDLHPNLASERWDGQANFLPQIEKAFADIKRKLKERGRRARMMIDATQIKDLIVCHALELVFFDFAKSTEDIWWNRYLKRAEQFAADLEALHISYDSDESGTVDEVASFGNVSLNR